jgi:RNA polymerase sigma factor (sigma-70 family)
MTRSDPSNGDRVLVARLAAGDERALAELYDRYGAMAYSLACSILHDPSEAEEAASDAFVQVWSTAASFDPGRASVGAWISMITRTRSLDRLRARKRRAVTVEKAAGLSRCQYRKGRNKDWSLRSQTQKWQDRLHGHLMKERYRESITKGPPCGACYHNQI